MLSITRLKLISCLYENFVPKLFENMPNLCYLSWHSRNIFTDGNELEEMIKKHLPKLKRFHFLMQFDYRMGMNETIDTFRTPFWIDEHQWFVRCHLYTTYGFGYDICYVLYSLPYGFDVFPYINNCHETESTYPNDDKYLQHDRVIEMCYQSSYSTDPILSRLCFNNVKSLSLTLPIDEQLLPIVFKLDQLTSLRVCIDKEEKHFDIQSQLQFVLDRTPHLYSLDLNYYSSYSYHLSPMKIRCASVRQLNVQGLIFGENNTGFNEEQYIQPSRSPLGIQCEMLWIETVNRRNIVDLVENMPNLQALNVICQDDNGTVINNFESPEGDEIVNWLYQYLPSTCTVTRYKCDRGDKYNIRIWIR
jgi:hypothetical protein